MRSSTTAASPRQGTRLGLAIAALVLALSATVVTSVAATAQDGAPTVATVTDDLGTYLVGEGGMTLYYFTRDVTTGQSVCYNQCAEAWPPLLVEEGQTVGFEEGVTGPLGVVPRADDTWMATYRGRPLYYFAGDEAEGDTNGEGQFGVWFVAQVDGTMPANPPAQTLAVADAGDLGSILTSQQGMTVYWFSNDVTPGVSTCSGDCLTAWPPVTVNPGNTAAGGDGVTGVVGLVPTADGSLQATYNGMPLYYFAQDEEPGDTKGQGQGDVWWVVAP